MIKLFSSIMGTKVSGTQDGPQGLFRCQTKALVSHRLICNDALEAG
jgi:hypothetical protein